MRSSRSIQTSFLPIYLDNHATTPVDERVVHVMVASMTEGFGNPNSVDHAFGRQAFSALEIAASQVGALVGAPPEHVAFTSGASEALRLALAFAQSRVAHRPLKIAATTIEHPALIDALEKGELSGDLAVAWLPVDDSARVSIEAIEHALVSGVDLVCVMAANNEVGTVQPIERIAARVAAAGAEFLVDATQAAGKIDLKAQAWNIDYLVLSAHKLYGPKGVGALVSPSVEDEPRPAGFDVHRSTPNVPGIVGLGEACRISREEMVADNARIAALRDRLQMRLIAEVPGLVVNGDLEQRLAANLHISIPCVPNGAIVATVGHQVALSTGAACASGVDAPSHVLRAMGLPAWRREGALRLSLGRFNTDEEIERAVAALREAVNMVTGKMRAGG